MPLEVICAAAWATFDVVLEESNTNFLIVAWLMTTKGSGPLTWGIFDKAWLRSNCEGVMDLEMKNTFKNRCSALALSAVALTSLAPGIAFAQEDAEASDDNDGVILVTARKREEDFMEVPLAITALGSDEIQARGITSVNDLVESTPGVNVSNVSSGRNDRSFQQISLRGFTPSTTTSTLTATFINGVPVASATALNSITDPARIEILKGPQNAYFGRNAFAGAINIVTQSPTDYFGGSVSAQASTRNGYDVQAALYGPIVDGVLSFRATGRQYGTDGTYVNGFNSNQTLGDQSTRTATLQFDFTPTENLTVRAFGLISENDDGPSADGMVSAYEVRSDGGAVNIPFYSNNTDGSIVIPSQANCMLTGFTDGIVGTEDPVVRPYICGAVPALLPGFSPSANTIEDPLLSGILANGDSRVVSPGQGVQGYGLVSRFYHLNLAVDYDIGDSGFTLSSLTGYNNEIVSEVDDLDNYDSTPLNGNPFNIPGARDVWNFPFLVERKNKDFSQEFRLTYDNLGPLQAMFGVSYLNATAEGDLVSVFAEEQFLAPRAPNEINAPGQAKTFGIFGSVSFDVTEALNISAEARWQQDEIFAKAALDRFGNPLVIGENGNGITPGSYGQGDTYFTRKYRNFLPRVIVSYDVNPDVMVYASFSQAVNVSIASFNTQFLNGTPSEVALADSLGLQLAIDPELLDNYEVGLKGTFADGRARITLAGFLADWTDQYNRRTVIGVDADTNLPVIVSGVANAGETQIVGLELDLWTEPVDGLVLTFSGALTDSSIGAFSDPSISKLTGLIDGDFDGNQLPLTSKYSANASFQYTGDINSWEDGSFFVRGDLNWKSKQFIDAGNLTWIEDRAVVNVRAGFTNDGYTFELFATNLFDDRNYTTAAQNNLLEPTFALAGEAFGYVNTGLPEGRIVGVRAGFEF